MSTLEGTRGVWGLVDKLPAAPLLFSVMAGVMGTAASTGEPAGFVAA